MKAQVPSLVRNILLNFGSRGALTLLSLVSTPVLVHRLGTQAYGVYVLAFAVGGLLTVLDLGLTPGFVQALSAAWHLQARHDMQRIVSTAFTLYLAIGLAGSAVAAVLVPWAVTVLLHVPPRLRTPAEVALWLSTASFAVNMWLAVFNSIPIALERYDLLTARTIVLSLLTTTAMILYALSGGGIEGLMAINFLASVSAVGVFYFVSRSLLPFIRFRPGFHRASFMGLARFSAFKVAGTVGAILTYRFDQFAIGAMLNVNAVGVYAVPANASSRVQALIAEFVFPFFPRVSKVQDDLDHLRALLLRGSRIVALLAAPLFVILFVFADFVLLYWIRGPQGHLIAGEASATFRWLLAAAFIQSLASVQVVFCEGSGKPEVSNGFAVASAVFNVPLVLLLVPRFGIMGAAVALFINTATQTTVFMAFASHWLARVSPRELFIGALARPIAAASLAGGVAYLSRPAVHGLLSLGAAALVALLIYLVAATLMGAVTEAELAYLYHITERLPLWFPGRSSVLRRRHEV